MSIPKFVSHWSLFSRDGVLAMASSFRGTMPNLPSMFDVVVVAEVSAVSVDELVVCEVVARGEE